MSPTGTPHLLHVFSTFVPAGPEMRTVRMINAWGQAYRHSILAIDGRTDAAKELGANSSARILPNIERANTPRTLMALRKLFKQEQPDLILSYNWGAFDSVMASRSLGWQARHIHHEDGFNADEAQQFKGRRVWTRRLLLPKVAKVVVPSTVLDGIASGIWKLKPNHTQLIPNGIDLSAFQTRSVAADLRAQLSIDPKAVVIGFVGHLRPVKNPVRLVRAFAEVTGSPAPHLLVLGEGEERDAIVRTAKEAGVSGRVHLVGHQANTAPWYNAMDMFAISSDSEQMPVAMLEAMASGLAVVSTDVGDVSHMLPDAQQEFLATGAEQNRTAALGQAMQALVNDEAKRAELGHANRQRVEERYSFDVMLDAYHDLFQTTLLHNAR